MDGIDSLYILEDDALFDADYPTLMQQLMDGLPSDWEVVFPGGQHHGPYEKVAEGVVRGQNIQRTHCYALRGRDVIAHLYQMWTEWPVQNPYRDFHCDWLLGPWTGLRKAYAPERFFVGQARTRSDINGRLNAPRLWNPPDPTAPILWLRNSSRATLEALLAHGCHPGYDRDGQGCDRGLNEAFSLSPGSAEMVDRLRRWRGELQAEVESMFRPAAVVTLWHPDAVRHEDAIRTAFESSPLIVADGGDVDAILQLWSQHRAAVAIDADR